MTIDGRGKRFEPASEDSPETTSLRLRIDAVSMVRRGATVTDAARAFDVSATSVRRWLRRSKEFGMEALVGPHSGGRPPGLAGGQMTSLRNDIQRPPAQFGYAGEQWSGALIARHLKNRYRMEITDRQGRRILRRLGAKESGTRKAKSNNRPITRLAFESTGSARRARPAWDGLNKEIALRRIKRLASSGLALEPFVRTLVSAIDDGVRAGVVKAFLANPGERSDAFIVNVPDVHARTVPAEQRYLVHGTPDESGFRVKFDPYSLKHRFLAKTVWPLEELMLPHFFRSAGYNEVVRPLNQKHGAWVVYQENGETAGFYPFWRDVDQPPLSPADISFLKISAPHIAHGLKAARLLTRNDSAKESGIFIPSPAWGSGIVLVDSVGRVVAADESARTIFAYLERFDIDIEAQQKKCAITDALQYIASVLKQIFHDRGGTGTMCAAPVVRLHSHWSGIVLRLRGIVAYGDDGGRYFTVIVEQGELKEHRQRRLMYRWGLSPREFEIIVALAENARTSEMAYRMHLSTGTLKAYLQRLADKLNVEGMSALRTFASQELAT